MAGEEHEDKKLKHNWNGEVKLLDKHSCYSNQLQNILIHFQLT